MTMRKEILKSKSVFYIIILNYILIYFYRASKSPQNETNSNENIRRPSVVIKFGGQSNEDQNEKVSAVQIEGMLI